MMRWAIISLTIGILASTASAQECYIPYSGFVFPFNCGCCCFGFFFPGTHLGLGPGYPGVAPPFPTPNCCSFYPGRYPSQLRTPPIASYALGPVTRNRDGQRNAPSGPIARDDSLDQPHPVRVLAGHGYRKSPPAPREEINKTAHIDGYISRRCYQGECSAIKPEEALSSDATPGIIVWEPEN